MDYWINQVLKALKKLGGEATPKAVRERLGVNGRLTDTELAETVSHTDLNKFIKKVTFARHYLVTTGYVENGEGGMWKFIEKGRAAGPLEAHTIESAHETMKNNG